jgi:hypothetical protein
MKISLLLPSQNNAYSNLYEVYNDLYNALTNSGVTCEIVEIRDTGNTEFPFYPVNEITLDQLSRYIDRESAHDTYFLTVDDFYILKWLYRRPKITNMFIWLHYFYGAKYIFQSYRISRRPLVDSFRRRIVKLVSGMVPNEIAIIQSKFYWNTLSRYTLFSQSLWTGMLTERVYSIPILGTIYIPVDQKLFTFTPEPHREGILVFLGDASDTDLLALWRIIRVLQEEHFGNIYYFGNELSGIKFRDTYGVKMNFIGKISRNELLRQYASHFLTITPVFNGNFEMVPIQSLLMGTPVVSFTQPFMEVTGESDMIANIHNFGEVRRKARLWKVIDVEVRNIVRSKIFENMDSRKVAKDLLNLLNPLDFH